jgi:hypothetical protein
MPVVNAIGRCATNSGACSVTERPPTYSPDACGTRTGKERMLQFIIAPEVIEDESTPIEPRSRA